MTDSLDEICSITPIEGVMWKGSRLTIVNDDAKEVYEHGELDFCSRKAFVRIRTEERFDDEEPDNIAHLVIPNVFLDKDSYDAYYTIAHRVNAINRDAGEEEIDVSADQFRSAFVMDREDSIVEGRATLKWSGTEEISLRYEYVTERQRDIYILGSWAACAAGIVMIGASLVPMFSKNVEMGLLEKTLLCVGTGLFAAGIRMYSVLRKKEASVEKLFYDNSLQKYKELIEENFDDADMIKRLYKDLYVTFENTGINDGLQVEIKGNYDYDTLARAVSYLATGIGELREGLFKEGPRVSLMEAVGSRIKCPNCGDPVDRDEGIDGPDGLGIYCPPCYNELPEIQEDRVLE